MRKKFTALLLTLLAMCSLLTPHASASVVWENKHGTDYTSGELATRLETIFYEGISGCVSPSLPAVYSVTGNKTQNKMNNSTIYTTTFANQGGSKRGYQCMAYARAAYSYLFGYDCGDSTYRDEFENAKGRSSLSYSLFSQYGVQCGAYIRTTENPSGSYDAAHGHSMIILSYDSKGLTTLEANYNNNGEIGVIYYLWSDFNQKQLGGRKTPRYVCSLSQPTKKVYSFLASVSSSNTGTCVITFDPNGGTVPQASKTVTAGSVIGDLPEPTRTGYTFLGWSTAKEGSGMIVTADNLIVDQDMTLYACWKNTYSLIAEGVYTLTPQCAPGMRLDVKGGDADSGTNIQIYTANGTDAQQFEFTYLADGYYRITAMVSGKVLDVQGGKTTSGTNVRQYNSNGTTAQQWMLKDAGDGYYYIIPRLNAALCLDVDDAGSSNSTNVQVWTQNSTNAQKWKLTKVDSTPSITITFDAQGGSVSPRTKTVTRGAAFGTLPTPVRKGYEFNGWWYDNDEAGVCVRITSSTLVDLTGSTTLYAVWKKASDSSSENIGAGIAGTTPAAKNDNCTTHTKGAFQFYEAAHPHKNYYKCAVCGELFTDGSTTPMDSCGECWGPWSGWSTVKVTASNTRQVETRQVKVSDGYTEYRYGRYVDTTGKNDCWCATYLESLSYVSGRATLQYSDWSTTRYSASGKDWSCGYCNGNHIGIDHTGSDGRSWWAEYRLPGGSYYWEESKSVDATYEIQYRYRDMALQ